MDLHEHLSAAMHTGGGVDGGGGGDAADDGSDDDGRHPLNQTGKKRAPPVGGREWRERARRVAEREWEFDAQGGDGLGHDLFLLSFFQVGRSERRPDVRRGEPRVARGTGGTGGTAGVAGAPRATSGFFRAGGGGDRATAPWIGLGTRRFAWRTRALLDSAVTLADSFRRRTLPRAQLVDVWRAGGADPSPATFAKVRRVMTWYSRGGRLNHCDVTAGRIACLGTSQ